jgi:hypothetical protein
MAAARPSAGESKRSIRVNTRFAIERMGGASGVRPGNDEERQCFRKIGKN